VSLQQYTDSHVPEWHYLTAVRVTAYPVNIHGQQWWGERYERWVPMFSRNTYSGNGKFIPVFTQTERN